MLFIANMDKNVYTVIKMLYNTIVYMIHTIIYNSITSILNANYGEVMILWN